MLRNIISSLATCNIFWASDFVQWRVAVDQMYPNKINKISNFGVFCGFSPSVREIIPSEQWNLKYVLLGVILNDI
jgi:hypothetical protein